MKICANPNCQKEFEPTHANQKYCTKECYRLGHIKSVQKKRLEQHPVVEKACEWCGKKFETRRSYMRFCCEKCQNEKANYKNRLKNLEKLKSIIIKCPECGKEFNPNSARQKYCSDTCKVKFLQRQYHTIKPKITKPKLPKFKNEQPTRVKKKKEYVEILKIQKETGLKFKDIRPWYPDQMDRVYRLAEYYKTV